ncbi:MAG TPA: hypothetical protein PLR25_11310, partial [Planctomycetaceae bacterium]|nr:hypothetical protein [Planctomycetaceae bacterium]
PKPSSRLYTSNERRNRTTVIDHALNFSASWGRVCVVLSAESMRLKSDMLEMIHPTCGSVTTGGAVAGVFGRKDGSESFGFATERHGVMMPKWFR